MSSEVIVTSLFIFALAGFLGLEVIALWRGLRNVRTRRAFPLQLLHGCHHSGGGLGRGLI